MSWLKFLDQIGAAGCPQIWPRGAHNGPNWPKMPKNGISKVPVVQNCWNSMEQRWNGSKNFGLDHLQLIPPSFHTVPTVLDHQNLEIAFCLAYWAILGAPGSNFWEPHSYKLPQKLQFGPPLTCSTFVLRCSNHFGPPQP